MGERQPSGGKHELLPLTDSLVSCIRWRLSDYEAIFRTQIELMLDASGCTRRLVPPSHVRRVVH